MTVHIFLVTYFHYENVGGKLNMHYTHVENYLNFYEYQFLISQERRR